MIKISLKTIAVSFFSLLLLGCATPAASTYSQRPAVKQFIQEVSAKDDFDRVQLSQLFDQVQSQSRIIEKMSAPHEALPWYRYRALFVKKSHIEGGVKFWHEHAAILAKAQQKYGVPPEIILPILGVETNYGHFLGKDRVIDSLSTLAFDYPPRAPFFRSELEQFLLLTRETPFKPLCVLGSYAGAIGQPQFMPSSYRRYAVDTSGKGYSDLIHNTNDAVMSVGNYFKSYGWQSGQPIAMRAHLKGQQYQILLQKPKDKHTIAEFAHFGVYPAEKVSANTSATLLPLTGAKGPEYWLVFHNFDVIMGYNASPHYAMAVNQLGELIKSAYQHKRIK